MVHILDGHEGEFDIQVDGKRFHFEWHSFCGPVNLNKNGDPAKLQPQRFLYAASQWNAQGRKMENGLCVWYYEPEPILKHMGGRNYLWQGEHPPVKGA